MSGRCTLILLIGLVLSAAVFAGENPSEKRHEPAQKQMDVVTAMSHETGKPRRLEIDLGKDGKAAVEVSLVPDKREIMVGEPLYLSLAIRNLSGVKLELVPSFDQGHGGDGTWGSYIRVVDEKGRVLPDKEEMGAGSEMFNPEEIPDKKPWTHRLFLPDWVKLTTAGDYTLIAKMGLKFRKRSEGAWDFFRDGTPSVSVQADVKVRVIPQDHKKMGAVIDKLGAVIDKLGNTAMVVLDRELGEAVEGLSYIEDDRAIPFFNRAMETKSYELRFFAVEALAKFKSDEALVGLKRAMTTRASDLDDCGRDLASNIRIGAADALTKSPNPAAKRLLFSMIDDSECEVRIRVLGVLEEMDTPESRKMLKKLTRDPEKRVRDEASEALKPPTEKPTTKEPSGPVPPKQTVTVPQ